MTRKQSLPDASVRIVTVGSATIDHVTLPDDTEEYVHCGGNAFYSAAGASMWSRDPVGVMARVGGDYPRECIDGARAAGIDISGVERVKGLKASRFEAVYDDTGDRAWSDPRDEAAAIASGDTELEPVMADGTMDHWPDVSHVHWAPVRPSTLVANLAWADQRGLWSQVDAGEESVEWSRSFTEQVLSGVGSFVSSQSELPDDIRSVPLNEAAAALLAAGPQIIVITMGQRGSVIHARGWSEPVHVPALDTHVVDPTGAGDAFAGGLLAGISIHDDAVVGAAWGTIAASFVVEGFGPWVAIPFDRDEQDRRRRWLARRIGHVLPSWESA